ncbi:MAG: hypothetical protein ACHQHN_16890 [Sphingobacteriales bacterium]
MKKRTMPIEPDEMPVQKPEPEIKQPNDPGPAGIPQENPERIPVELPPDTSKPDHDEPEQPGKIS